MSSLSLRIVEAYQNERIWRLRIPFHYGTVTLNEAIEIHVTCLVEVEGRRPQYGYAAELAAPKWFEKSITLSPQQTVERLRCVVHRALDVLNLLDRSHKSVARLSRGLMEALLSDEKIVRKGLNRLEVSFAVALIERAAIDGLCRALDAPFFEALTADALGFSDDCTNQREGAYLRAWLGALRPTNSVPVRHTIGMADQLEAAADVKSDDERPVSLVDVIAKDRVSRFKIKTAGTPDSIERLTQVAAVLDRHETTYTVSLDANEAFAEPSALADFLGTLSGEPRLKRFWSSVRYVEQPFDRTVALNRDLTGWRFSRPLVIDESDDSDEAFALGLKLGYSGVSVKTCKGVGRALRNASRAASSTTDGRSAFITGEDLCVQPGIALQQNIALGAVLALPDAERNGHHFGPGPRHLPRTERTALRVAHPDLYREGEIILHEGAVSAVSSLRACGFGTDVAPVHFPTHSAMQSG
jgi:hypothetical protein